MKNYFRKYEAAQRRFQAQQQAEDEKVSGKIDNKPKEEALPTTDLEFFKAEHAELVFYQESAIIQLRWKGFIETKNYKPILDATLVMYEEKQARKILIDATELEAISNENQEWTSTTWCRRLVSKGVEQLVCVLPKDMFGELSLKYILEKCESKYKIKIPIFPNTEEAIEWMTQ
ncbi:MAG: hypothetical protein AB8B61_10275 [Cyclobacteriaceae bacterium]